MPDDPRQLPPRYLRTPEAARFLGLSDRILVMRAGHVVARFDHDEASEEKIIAAALGAANSLPTCS